MTRLGPLDPGVIGLTPRRSVTDLLWVVNTGHGPAGHWFARVTSDQPDHDHLSGEADAVKYLADHRVTLPSEALTDRQIRAMSDIRTMVRGLLDPASGWTPAVRAMLDDTRFRVDPEGRLAAEGSGWDGFIGDLMVPLIRLVEQRGHLRACGNPDCRLMFLDLSKNQSRLWCDNAGCGNRNRVRRYRARAQVDPVLGAKP